jgi:hypothetical protein
LPRRSLLLIPAAVLAVSAACGGGGDNFAPEFLDVTSLSGRYRVTLTLTPDPGSPSAATCGQLEITIATQITWQGLDCAIREADGARNAGSQDIVLRETVDVVGGGTATRVAYFFFPFMGTPDRPTSGWLGPCTDAAPGGGTACIRESGSATWVRQ